MCNLDSITKGQAAICEFTRAMPYKPGNLPSVPSVPNVALTQMIDTDTGEVLEEPAILARYGELPAEFREE